MIKGKRILVAPLNWGLGHASRCIPIIHDLIRQGNTVILAADGKPLQLLQQEFPELQSVQLTGLEIRYPKLLPVPIYFGLKMPQLLLELKKEKEATQRIVEDYEIDLIISDNRYGVFHDEVKSILVTHQLFVKSPIFERHVQQFIHSKIQQFDECWIPDYEGVKNLSGSLSHGQSKLENLKFIGPLSRFKKERSLVEHFDRKVMVVLSGPEPNRTNLEKKLIDQLKPLNISALVVRGMIKPKIEREVINNRLSIVSHLDSKEMNQELLRSEVIICRSGYSSIMDLNALDKKALIIPTKGQTEQEYLATYLGVKEEFHTAVENQLDLKTDLKYFGVF